MTLMAIDSFYFINRATDFEEPWFDYSILYHFIPIKTYMYICIYIQYIYIYINPMPYYE